MTTNQNAYGLIITNGRCINPINRNEIKGTIVNDDIENQLNLEEITAKEYLDIVKKHDEEQKSILPYIDLESKDEKGHLYFLPLGAIYEHLGYAIPHKLLPNMGYICRKKDICKPFKIKLTYSDGRTMEV